MAIDIGQQAPDFSLKDQRGEVVSLSDYAGKQAVALVFYPFTFTAVCEGELCRLRDDFSEFADAGVQVLACSSSSSSARTCSPATPLCSASRPRRRSRQGVRGPCASRWC